MFLAQRTKSVAAAGCISMMTLACGANRPAVPAPPIPAPTADRRATAPSPSIEFDAKGADFQPWIRNFMSRVYRNWIIPASASSQRGHAVVTVDVLKDGTLSGASLQESSGIDTLDQASLYAITAMTRALPLPPEYPDTRVKFTVTFYYNERPR
jgi:TonB family protein